jgi:dolichol-phosphate mannosyltransferase
VGGIGALLNLAVLFSLVEWLFVRYILGAAISFGVAASSNYVLNKKWTFHDETIKTYSIFGSYMRFISVSIIGLAINLVTLYVLVDCFHI